NEMDANQRYDEIYKKGEESGIKKGEVIGIKKGEVIGLKKGEVIGIKKGEIIGLKTGLRKAVYSMSQKGMGALEIANLLDEPIETVQEILNEKEGV
ncbi:MAG: hypothetical protein ACI32A_02945, partial [Floccifex sp.]